MTLEPTDQFDVIVAEGLRGRAAHATAASRAVATRASTSPSARVAGTA